MYSLSFEDSTTSITDKDPEERSTKFRVHEHDLIAIRYFFSFQTLVTRMRRNVNNQSRSRQLMHSDLIRHSMPMLI